VGRKVEAQVQQLESILNQSVATINISPKLLYNIAAGQNYMSYYKAMDQQLRGIAERKYHEDRTVVDGKIHPGYGSEILNAALSPDGRGLMNYGRVTLELRQIAIEDRASVLRENAFDFFERYDLGHINAEEQPGWRAIWSDRAHLGVAHLGPTVTPAMSVGALADQVLLSGIDRHGDRYMEVHIYGELSWQSLSKVTLERPLTDAKEQDDWDFGRQKLAGRGVTIIDRANP
jgi:hypothetical protein